MARKDMTYIEAGHAIQSGIAAAHARGSKDGTPKHLRTGITLAKTDHCGLVRLLMSKNLITEQEYMEAIRIAAIEEVERYEAELTKATGIEVTLL